MNGIFRLDGKTALITGGASGIGEATARLFSEAGAEVLVVDIDGARAESVANSLPNSRALRCDITDEDDVKRLFAGIDRLDILVNCAGIGLVGSIEETD